MSKISVVLPTFNEAENLQELSQRLKSVTALSSHEFEFVFIDNASTDATVEILEQLASGDHRFKVIVNATNFGHIRSPYHGMLQTDSDATILMASDLQDPPELITELVSKWEAGNKVVLLVRTSTDEHWPMKSVRKLFYSAMARMSDSPLVSNSTGSGIFDREVISVLRSLEDPYPYFRGLVVELGFKSDKVEFHQPLRKKGVTKNNFRTLFDLGIVAFITHSSWGPRLFTFVGFVTAALGMIVGIGYLVAKILFWDAFELGQAPVLIGIFVFGSIQIFLIGLLGEYLTSIQRRLRKLPLVIEERRINFD